MSHKAMPESKQRKPDTTKNGSVSNVLDKVKENEKDKVRLVIRESPYWAIMVKPDKCNEEYREEYIKRMGVAKPKPLVGVACKTYSIKEKLTRDVLLETKHLTLAEAAKELGVAKETIRNYRRKLLNG